MIFYSAIAYYGMKGLFLSLLALGALALMRKSPASSKNFLAVSALVAMLVLPLASRFVLPHQVVHAPPAISKPILYFEMPAYAAYEAAQSSPSSGVASYEQALPLIDYICMGLASLWLIGFCLLSIRIIGGVVRTARMARGTPSIRDGVLISDSVQVPMTVWIGRPTILLPREASSWDEQRLSRVILHERAHVQRHDLFWNFIALVCCAIYWPLPTVWALRRIARDTAERACDDQVLRSGAFAPDYAQDIVELSRPEVTRVPVLALQIVSKSELGKRVSHILDETIRRGATTFKDRISSFVVAVALLVPVAVYGIASIPAVRQESNPPPFVSVTIPGSIPGTKENGFVGTTHDGRKIELVQIQHKGKHGFEAWKPDGTMIKNPMQYGKAWWLDRSTHIEQIFRIHTSSPNPRLASVTYSLGIPGECRYAMEKGGEVLPADRSGSQIAIGRPELAPSGSGLNSCTFMYQSQEVKPVFSISLKEGEPVAKDMQGRPAPQVHDLSIRQNVKAEVVQIDGRHGHLVTKKFRWELEFIVDGHSPIDLSYKELDKNGADHYLSMSAGGPVKGGVHVFLRSDLPLKDVARIQIQHQETYAVDFMHVVVRSDLLHPN